MDQRDVPEHDQRRTERTSLMVSTDMRLAGEDIEHRVRIRNLSAKGMMAEGGLRALPGALVEVAVKDHGWIAGAVAWVQDDRLGIAFREDIDPAILQDQTTGHDDPCASPGPARSQAPGQSGD